jgi:MFS family permease
MRLYKNKTFSAASMTMFCLGASLMGSMILLPLYWQTVRGYSVLHTGLLTGWQGIGMALILPLAGRLTDRFGGGPMALYGVTVTVVATIPFAMLGAHTPVPYIAAAMIFRGTGIGFAFMPAMTAAFASLKRSQLADATPQMNVLQRVGGSIGTALFAVVLQRALAGAHTPAAEAAAFGAAFWAAMIMAALALFPCIVLVRAERAARLESAAAAPPEALAEAVAA